MTMEAILIVLVGLAGALVLYPVWKKSLNNEDGHAGGGVYTPTGRQRIHTRPVEVEEKVLLPSFTLGELLYAIDTIEYIKNPDDDEERRYTISAKHIAYNMFDDVTSTHVLMVEKAIQEMDCDLLYFDESGGAHIAMGHFYWIIRARIMKDEDRRNHKCKLTVPVTRTIRMICPNDNRAHAAHKEA